MQEIQQVLTDLGFEKRERSIYLSLIRQGDLTALQLARDTYIDRTTTYDLLDRLIAKGIVSQYTKNKSRYFRALAPEGLLASFKDKYRSLERVLPELQKLAHQSSAPITCELFHGKDGLKSVLKEFIGQAKEYRVIGIRQEYEDILGYFADQGILQLDAFKAKEIAIVEKGARFRKLKQGDYRYLSKSLLSPLTTLIYSQTVIFFIWTEPCLALRVRNATFAKAQQEYFSLLWKSAA